MALVIYDSTYGNTRLVAEAIAETLGADVKCAFVDEVQAEDLQKGLVVIGCPINAWRPTPKITKFLKDLAPSSLAGVNAASFDTRVDSLFSGNAAKKIAKGLKRAGATLIAPPQAFYVKGTNGPLADGEIQKAKTWARLLLETSNTKA